MNRFTELGCVDISLNSPPNAAVASMRKSQAALNYPFSRKRTGEASEEELRVAMRPSRLILDEIYLILVQCRSARGFVIINFLCQTRREPRA